ncbi:RNA recognition motif domain-containing protein [Salinivibrio socompensis]|uniref:RNA recognition motif domain-containing protein n=1 Tax=Salinivibrio socompensis TaxID=1510206 RepID=UPI0004B03F60|nr:RNA-binding protein [Salinivibrio socompensis]
MKSPVNFALIICIAVLGAIIINLMGVISPAIAFAAGAIISGLACLYLPLPDFKPSTQDYPEPNTANNEEESPQSKTLYVGNLPYRANENDVRTLFSEHGEVFAVRLMKDKRTGKRRGFGFVVMAAAQADDAINSLNNNVYGERTLKVREANDPKKQENS